MVSEDSIGPYLWSLALIVATSIATNVVNRRGASHAERLRLRTELIPELIKKSAEVEVCYSEYCKTDESNFGKPFAALRGSTHDLAKQTNSARYVLRRDTLKRLLAQAGLAEQRIREDALPAIRWRAGRQKKDFRSSLTMKNLAREADSALNMERYRSVPFFGALNHWLRATEVLDQADGRDSLMQRIESLRLESSWSIPLSAVEAILKHIAKIERASGLRGFKFSEWETRSGYVKLDLFYVCARYDAEGLSLRKLRRVQRQLPRIVERASGLRARWLGIPVQFVAIFDIDGNLWTPGGSSHSIGFPTLGRRKEL